MREAHRAVVNESNDALRLLVVILKGIFQALPQPLFEDSEGSIGEVVQAVFNQDQHSRWLESCNRRPQPQPYNPTPVAAAAAVAKEELDAQAVEPSFGPSA